MIPTTSPSRELMKRKRSGRLARRESWIKKVKPIYVEDIDWSLTVLAFENVKKDAGESNLNFTTRLKGLFDTMHETCAREESAVIPYGYQDEPGLVARSITLLDKGMMKKIFEDRIRDDKRGMLTTYQEFQEEILTYEQRNRAVNAMPGAASLPAPAPAPALGGPPTSPPGGGGRGGAGRGRGRGAVRQLVTGRGRGEGGQ